MPPFYHNPIPNTSGIYRITCTSTGKIYIGSAINLRMRRKSHYGDLQRNKHHSEKLQHAWNKYGENSFIFEILELVLPPFLIEREQYWLDTLQPFGNQGFNNARVAGSALGHKHSDEAKSKMRAARLGKPNPNGGNRKGRKASPETLAKMSRAHLGNPSNLGRKLTPEHRAHISASLMGNSYALGVKHSEETREKLRKAQTNRPPASDETLAKLSRGIKAAWAEGKIGTQKTYIVTDPDGKEYVVQGIFNFCRQHGLDYSALIRVAKGKNKHHKGWKARFPDMD